MSLLGINSPTQGFTQTAQRTAAAVHAEVVLWLSSAGPQDAAWVAAHIGPALHVVRLDTPTPGEAPTDYAARVNGAVLRWWNTPGVCYQPGNECDIEGWALDAWLAAAPRYTAAMKARFAGIRLTSVPLSVANTRALTGDCVRDCDYCNVHAYIEAAHPEDMDNEALGASWKTALRFGAPILVSELNTVGGTRPDLLVPWLRGMGAQVAAVALFLADGQGQWASFDVSPDQAAAIRAGLRAPPPSPSPPTPPPLPPEPPMATTDIPALLAAIAAVSDRPHMADAMLMGAALETSLKNIAQYGGGPGRGYFQIEAGPGGSHTGEISEQDAFDPVKAAQFMAADYRSGLGFVSDWTSDPAWALATAAYHAERPAAMYPRDRVDAAYARIQPYLNSAPPPAAPGVTDERIVAAAMKYEGVSHFSDEGADTPSYYRCEEWVEVVQEDCGLPRVRYSDANADADSAPLNDGHAPAGALVFFQGTGWSQYGHVGISLGDGRTISALSTVRVTEAWQDAAGYRGWRYPAGVGPTPAPSPAPARSGLPFATDPVDDGLVQLAWTAHGVPWNPDAGIYRAWKDAVYGQGVLIGVPVTPEKDVGWGIVQPFSSGVLASWNKTDHQIRWHGTLPK